MNGNPTWNVERKLYLPAGVKADAELIVHETIRGNGIVVEGFSIRACECHNPSPLAVYEVEDKE